jgi:hypothetical protein
LVAAAAERPVVEGPRQSAKTRKARVSAVRIRFFSSLIKSASDGYEYRKSPKNCLGTPSIAIPGKGSLLLNSLRGPLEREWLRPSSLPVSALARRGAICRDICPSQPQTVNKMYFFSNHLHHATKLLTSNFRRFDNITKITENGSKTGFLMFAQNKSFFLLFPGAVRNEVCYREIQYHAAVAELFASVKRRTQLRPDFFAAYTARSAALSRWLTSRKGHPGSKLATPMLAVTGSISLPAGIG